MLFMAFFLGCKTEEPKNLITSPTQNLPLNPLKDNITKVVEVKSKTGRIWMDRNLGATQVATSSTDEKAYGDLYQWGRESDGHQKRDSPVSNDVSSSDKPGINSFILSVQANWRIPQNDNLWQGLYGINNVCPTGFRLPTTVEWEEEVKSWNTVGYISPSMILDAFNSPLKITVGGYRNPSNGQGSIERAGMEGLYWSSTIYEISGTNYKQVYFQWIKNTSGFIFNSNRAAGMSVRCIKD